MKIDNVLRALSFSCFFSLSFAEENEEFIEKPLLINKESSYPYSENLNIKALPRNNVLTSFEFKLESEPVNISSSSDTIHYKVFPRSLAPILESTNTRELHLRFGQGWWDAEEWGKLPSSGASSGGIGVEVWAVIEAKNKTESFEQWLTLTNSLSGLFCASFNFIDSSKTIYPIRSFESNDKIPLLDPNNQVFLLRAALASEPVCTENLTPFVKFLPPKGKTGLSSLLDGHRVFDSQWHMMSIDIQTECEEDISKYKMDQKIDAVINIDHVLRRKQFNHIPKPIPGNELRCDPTKPNDIYECFPLGDSIEFEFSLEDLFGSKIKGATLLSNEPAKICAIVDDEWEVLLNVDDDFYGIQTNCFELKDNADYDLYIKTSNSEKVPRVSRVPVFVTRSLSGYQQDKGQSRINFHNPSGEDVTLLYLESLPWFMRVYLQSLSVSGGEKDEIVKNIYYSPEVDRKRPTHIEFELIIPANTTIELSYSFDKSLLLYAEYPPDANHGFSVEPGVVKVLEPKVYYARTSPALLTLPTPDFSMPYNVIILSSTIMALSFGTIFNLLVKRTVTEEEAELIISETGPKAKIQKIKERLISRFQSILEAPKKDVKEVKELKELKEKEVE